MTTAFSSQTSSTLLLAAPAVTFSTLGLRGSTSASATVSAPPYAAVSRSALLQLTEIVWLDAQLTALAALPNDWDGYGAAQIEIMRLNQIGAILSQHLPVRMSAGSIVPGADGSIQGEWHTLTGSFGLIVDDFGRVSAWMRPTGGDETEAEGLNATNLLRYAALASMV